MLDKYKRKRNFEKTPEPSGEIATKKIKDRRSKIEKSPQLRFVIQKHEASHLHYDLRLESEGVMKSWAVPKGPSLNPEDKRLAMEVEDHPIEYNDFEGTIPEGNYGAGTVMIWDEGFYSPLIVHDDENEEEAVIRHLKDGHLKFRLYGKKLNGEFAIVKMQKKTPQQVRGAWLLIKHDDEFANKSISREDISVRSGRTMEAITDGKAQKVIKWNEIHPTDPAQLRHGFVGQAHDSSFNVDVEPEAEPVKSKLPTEVTPMLAAITEAPFDNDEWLYELKWDGYRALAEVNKGKVRLYSRNNQDFNDDFPEVVKALEKLPGTLLLDGEVVAVDEKGVPKFQLLQKHTKGQEQKLLFYVFDILYFAPVSGTGFDLRDLSLIKRKEILKDLIKEDDVIRLSETFEDGESLFKSSKKLGMEGIMAKRKNSKYLDHRSTDWLKIKSANEREFVIGGYTKPKGNRKHFGSILLGEYVNGKFVYRGLAGTGFNDQSMKELQVEMDKHQTVNQPFAPTELIQKKTVQKWIKPKIVVQVKFAEWTEEKLLRHPVYLGIRKDKKPTDVIAEPQLPQGFVGRATTSSHNLTTTTTLPNLEFTHLDKIYFPRDKYTKQDLLEYYNEIGDVMMPYLIDRPQNLNRHPNGIDGESFYQKDFDASRPDYVKRHRIYSKSTKKYVDYLLCQNKETLLFLGNLGCIEINAWNSRIDTLDNPDYVLFDLDPVKVDFKDVVKVAKEIHNFCEELKIPSFCKTSGKRGIHVYIPLQAKYNFEQIKIFAELVSVNIQNKLPKIVSLERSPKDRVGKVYIDYIQNRKGQTTACAYSVRPVDGAPVSTPLDWDEVDGRLDPKKFHIKNFGKRIEKVGDLWKGVLEEGIDLEKVIKDLAN